MKTKALFKLEQNNINNCAYFQHIGKNHLDRSSIGHTLILTSMDNEEPIIYLKKLVFGLLEDMRRTNMRRTSETYTEMPLILYRSHI